jgi:hypothetical protein
VIGGTPLPVKDWATATFGTNDKTFLVGGVLVLLFAFAAVIGALSIRFVGVTAGLGVPSTLTWNGNSSTAPDTPAGAASTATPKAAAAATASVQFPSTACTLAG